MKLDQVVLVRAGTILKLLCDVTLEKGPYLAEFIIYYMVGDEEKKHLCGQRNCKFFKV